MPISSLGAVNQLWTVCCVLSNFMNPVLTNEEDDQHMLLEETRTELSQELLKAFTLEILNAVNVCLY